MGPTIVDVEKYWNKFTNDIEVCENPGRYIRVF